jgi:hypothetical protein
MNERVVYTIVQNGSDAAAFGGLFEALLFGGVLILFALRLRRIKRSGHPLVSQSLLTTKLWNFLADHAKPIVAVTCCLAFVLSAVAWNHYRVDRNAIASGQYQTVVGALSGYLIASVTRSSQPSPKRLIYQIPGMDPTVLHEQDAIVVNGVTFYVDCDQPLEEPWPTVGNNGRCLALHSGQTVRIDFMKTSDDTYRTEPLRIAIIE